MLYRRTARSNADRKGTATVELAVCLPVLVLIVFASIEACNMIFLQQTLSIACYEGVREAVKYNSTKDKVRGRAEAVLDSRGVNGATITLDPSDPAKAERGDRITITVSANSNDNTSIASWFFGNRVLSSENVMVKE